MTPAPQIVTVLFARADSIYRQIPGCDVWDKDRDAMKWLGGTPVIAHPPCRLWGRLRAFVTHPELGERELAMFAVAKVREFGGVLEHPAASTLWKAADLPLPTSILHRVHSDRDSFGGFTVAMPQWWFGHAAEKATWFYIVGCEPTDLPTIPMKLGEPDFVVQSRKRSNCRPHIPKADRERTPLAMAEWLVQVARKTRIRELSI